MHVGLDGLPLTSPKTGVGHYTFELGRALAMLSPADKFEFVSHQKLTESALRDIEEDSPRNLRAINTRRYRKWWAVGLPRYIKNTSLDLFHGTNFEVPLWNKRHNVLTIHDLSTLLHPDKHENKLARRARRRLPIMVQLASAIVTPSEQVKTEICQHLSVDSNRVFVTPEAPRRSFHPLPAHLSLETKRKLDIEDDFILFVGTLEPRKNLSTLVRAFDHVLRNTGHRPQLVLAGSQGWLMDEWTELIGNLNLGDRLRLTGYLSDQELRALYSSCRMFVYPSIYEGFGLPPLEAMACGAPVIASDIPVFHETLGEAALFFTPTDVNDLARTMVELLKNEEHRRSLSLAGVKQAAKFSWETTARLTMNVYQAVIAGTQKSANKD